MKSKLTRNIGIRAALLIVVLGAPVLAASPQNSEAAPLVDGSKCSEVAPALDRAFDAARDANFVVVISRPGRGEQGTVWARRRLHNVRTYFFEVWELPQDRIVTAIGDRVNGPARVEIYALDRLLAVITTGRNKDVIVSKFCEGEVFSYYPHKVWWEQHHRRKRGSAVRHAPN
jgi:hypothetical protein